MSVRLGAVFLLIIILNVVISKVHMAEPPAVATGIKRVFPESIVISYQGDGDLAAIGGNNIIQAANRGEKITVFFVNNAIYGMTGGQMAPTSLLGQKTTTTPRGRTEMNEGYPIRIAEMISTLEAPIYIERVALTDPKNTNKVRRAVRKGLQLQMENKGFSLIEILSACPSGWKMTPVQAKEWIHENMEKVFPLGVFKDKTQEIEQNEPVKHVYSIEQLKEKINIPTNGALTKVDESKDVDHTEQRFIMAGFGGQGILMLGLGMTQAGMMGGYNVSWIPSYGPEMRGGTANCHVNLSSKRIGSPLVSKPSVLVAMNLPSLEKFEPDVEPGGVIIYDSSLIGRPPLRKDVKVLGIPATKIADEMGNTRVANMVILGAIIAQTSILSKKVVFKSLPSFIKHKKLIPLNEQAIEKGMEFVSDQIQV